ncbi:MAG: SDR family oxidoreductase [Planctomycetes bacterium]|nr:SDR family oxidoreductase [Planctomycetota bacterium]
MEAIKKKKRVLITGCSSGFGLLTAVEAARAGYDVVATMRNLGKADYLRQALDQAGATATIERLDVTDRSSIEAVAEKYRSVDILVNNAGILTMGSFLDITEDEMRTIFETNYFGVVALTRAVVGGGMIENGSGLVINIASLAGLIGHIFNAAYCASKHALVGFSKSIRQELKPFNINVVSVEPGYHKTEIIRANANVSENFYDQDSPMLQYNRGFLRLMRDEIIPRAGEAQDVVKTIMKIMAADKPKAHYVIGKDARLATTMQWLGLNGVLEKKIHTKLLSATRRENRRAEARKTKRKKPPANQ